MTIELRGGGSSDFGDSAIDSSKILSKSLAAVSFDIGGEECVIGDIVIEPRGFNGVAGGVVTFVTGCTTGITGGEITG